jgi:hypothetical protein
MAVATKDRADQRYVGDAAAKVVHDSMHEDPTPAGCRLGPLLRSGEAVRFEPDKLRQATAEGYEMCGRCLYRLDDRPGQTMKRLM